MNGPPLKISRHSLRKENLPYNFIPFIYQLDNKIYPTECQEIPNNY